MFAQESKESCTKNPFYGVINRIIISIYPSK